MISMQHKENLSAPAAQNLGAAPPCKANSPLSFSSCWHPPQWLPRKIPSVSLQRASSGFKFLSQSNLKRRAWLLTTGPTSPSVCLTDELDFPGFKYSNLISANGGCQLQQEGRMPCSYCQIWIYPPFHIMEASLMRTVTCCLFFTLMLRQQRKSRRTRNSVFPLESHGLLWNGHNLCSTSLPELSYQRVHWVGEVLIL